VKSAYSGTARDRVFCCCMQVRLMLVLEVTCKVRILGTELLSLKTVYRSVQVPFNTGT
jgi:hypothetical protein